MIKYLGFNFKIICKKWDISVFWGLFKVCFLIWENFWYGGFLKIILIFLFGIFNFFLILFFVSLIILWYNMD